MANAYGRQVDHTHLSLDQAERRGFLHRDYISHCLRWTHVANFLMEHQKYKTARVLDVGCGIDLPMAKMLYSSRLIVEDYVGVDYNSPGKFNLEPFKNGKFPLHAYGDVEFPKDLVLNAKPGEVTEAKDLRYTVGKDNDEWHELPTVITFFEVFEHIEPAHGRNMLVQVLKLLVAGGGTLFMSTPCYNKQVGAADNHVSETTYQALGALLEDLGFAIIGKWGTFASQKDYKDQFLKDYGDQGRDIWAKLTEYYDSNYLATVLAPLYPEHSRNVLWQLKAAPADYTRQFPALSEENVKTPWTSSDKWKDLMSPVPPGAED